MTLTFPPGLPIQLAGRQSPYDLIQKNQSYHARAAARALRSPIVGLTEFRITSLHIPVKLMVRADSVPHTIDIALRQRHKKHRLGEEYQSPSSIRCNDPTESSEYGDAQTGDLVEARHACRDHPRVPMSDQYKLQPQIHAERT